MSIIIGGGDHRTRELVGHVLDVCRTCRAICWIAIYDHALVSSIGGIEHSRYPRGSEGMCLHCGLQLAIDRSAYPAGFPRDAVGVTPQRAALEATNPRLLAMLDTRERLRALAAAPYRDAESAQRLRRVLPLLEQALLSADPVADLFQRFAGWEQLTEVDRLALCDDVERSFPAQG